MKRVRPHLTYANVMATLALFVALGGSSYAALTITGRNVKNNSLTYRDLQKNTLGGSRIKESRLGKVPKATNADRLGGRSVTSLLQSCPAGTQSVADYCVEIAARAAAAYGVAVENCAIGHRRLPTHAELRQALDFDNVTIAPGGELTSSVYGAPLNVVIAIDEIGNTSSVPNTAAGARAYRCIVGKGA